MTDLRAVTTRVNQGDFAGPGLVPHDGGDAVPCTEAGKIGPSRNASPIQQNWLSEQGWALISSCCTCHIQQAQVEACPGLLLSEVSHAVETDRNTYQVIMESLIKTGSTSALLPCPSKERRLDCIRCDTKAQI